MIQTQLQTVLHPVQFKSVQTSVIKVFNYISLFLTGFPVKMNFIIHLPNTFSLCQNEFLGRENLDLGYGHNPLTIKAQSKLSVQGKEVFMQDQ